MLSMAHYIQNFDLTSQQDAAEVFLHLLTSLREEFSDCFLPSQCSLAEVCATSYRIITPRRIENQSEQEDIEKIKRCTEQDFCDCRRHFHLDKLPWSNKFSCTLKHISIARCPKIICIHLKRVSIQFFGELVKLRGHISFPLVLDLFPFTTSGVGIKNWEENMRRGPVEQQSKNPSTCSNQFTIPSEQRQLDHVYGLTRGGFYPEELASDMSRFTANSQVLPGESIFPRTAGFP